MPDYSGKTKAELDEIARVRNIAGRSSMSRDELEKALKKDRKGGTTSKVVTPRERQGQDKGVAYLDDGEERDLSGTGEIAPSDNAVGTADGGSLGGTITGTTPPSATAPRPNPGTSTTPP